jgi:hypothetical protein
MTKSKGISLLTITLALALAACSQADDGRTNSSDASGRLESQSSSGLGTNRGQALLIIGWNMAALVDRDAITTLVREQASTCIKAGPDKCVVMDAIASNEDGEARGMLQVQADPVWLETYREQIAKDIDKASGKITADGLNVSNVSDQVRDLEREAAASRQQRTNAVADVPGNVTDAAAGASYAEAPRALVAPSAPPPPRVQAQDLRAQTKLQSLAVRYNSKPSVMSSRAMTTIQSALSASSEVLATAVSMLIYALSFLLPFGLLLWAGLALRKRFMPNFGVRAQPAYARATTETSAA